MYSFANNKINLTLCGMMGSGKSIVGKLLARKINFNFIDTDKFIEKKIGKSINKIFSEDGEGYFRELEEKTIINILKKKKYVISLGGGAILNKRIRNVIKNNSYNIYLKVSIDILTKRLENSKNRPLIKNKDINKVLIDLIKKREKFYKKSELIIKNETNINDIVENICDTLKLYD